MKSNWELKEIQAAVLLSSHHSGSAGPISSGYITIRHLVPHFLLQPGYRANTPTQTCICTFTAATQRWTHAGVPTTDHDDDTRTKMRRLLKQKCTCRCNLCSVNRTNEMATIISYRTFWDHFLYFYCIQQFGSGWKLLLRSLYLTCGAFCDHKMKPFDFFFCNNMAHHRKL